MISGTERMECVTPHNTKTPRRKDAKVSGWGGRRDFKTRKQRIYTTVSQNLRNLQRFQGQRKPPYSTAKSAKDTKKSVFALFASFAVSSFGCGFAAQGFLRFSVEGHGFRWPVD
jgi:hypothetical protein